MKEWLKKAVSESFFVFITSIFNMYACVVGVQKNNNKRSKYFLLSQKEELRQKQTKNIDFGH